MNARISFGALCLALLVETATPYRPYQAQIPNGAWVLDPCNNISVWGGVGHQTRDGRTARNPFGQDFSRHGHVWTKDLCQLDSDGDGMSNGQELGDPDCTWRSGQVIKGPAHSHPGVCEPLSSPLCINKNSWLNCRNISSTNQSMCAGIKSNTTFSKDLLLNATLVPSRETTYFCQLFDLNVTSDLHMIATEPLISASQVVHHILLFGCDPRDGVHFDPELWSPYPCVMVPHEFCRSLIGAWTVGSPGECAHTDMGFRVGRRGYRIVAIQIHWNNPTHLEGIIDSSGLRIFLTSTLRSYDAGMLVVGQQFLQIEPNLNNSTAPHNTMKFSATCPERCTRVMFKTPIFVTSAVNHMHYLGQSQHIKVYHNNSQVKVITDQNNYDYDDPVIHTFLEPIRINPGDEIRTTCVYKLTSALNPVCWGEATSEEMCFGFITYYPLQSLSHPWCTSMNNFPSCDRHLPALSMQPVDGCPWWQFRNFSHPDTKRMMGRVLDRCYSLKMEKLVCTEECQEAARTVADHPCLQGDTGSYMIDKFKLAGGTTRKLLDAVITCSCGIFSYCDRKTPQGLLGKRQGQFCQSSASFGRTRWWMLIVLWWMRIVL